MGLSIPLLSPPQMRPIVGLTVGSHGRTAVETLHIYLYIYIYEMNYPMPTLCVVHTLSGSHNVHKSG